MTDVGRPDLERMLKIALSETRVIISTSAITRLADRLHELLELDRADRQNARRIRAGAALDIKRRM